MFQTSRVTMSLSDSVRWQIQQFKNRVGMLMILVLKSTGSKPKALGFHPWFQLMIWDMVSLMLTSFCQTIHGME